MKPRPWKISGPRIPARRPFVTANFAITADGRISTRSFTPSDFSSPYDKRRLVEIRSQCDAIMVSAKTLSADNMSMGLPDEKLREARVRRGKPAFPLRVILSNSGRIDPTLNLFQKRFSPIVIFSTTRMPDPVQRALSSVANLHLNPGGHVDLEDMLQTLRRDYNVRRLVSEGGGQVLRALVEADLLDELHVTICPLIFGGTGAPTLTGAAGEFLPRGVSMRIASFEKRDAEYFLRYRIDR